MSGYTRHFTDDKTTERPKEAEEKERRWPEPKFCKCGKRISQGYQVRYPDGICKDCRALVALGIFSQAARELLALRWKEKWGAKP